MTDNIIIALFIGPIAVTMFVVTQSLSRLAFTLLQSVGGSTWAGLCMTYEAGDVEGFKRRLIGITRVTATLAAAVTFPLASITKPFVTLWLSAPVYAGDVLALLALAHVFFLSIYSIWGWMFNGLSRPHCLLNYLKILTLVNLLISLGATWLIGIPGPLIGTVAGHILYTSWKLPSLLKSEFGIPRKLLLKAALTPLTPLVPLMYLSFMLRDTWPDYTWARIVVEGLTLSSAYLVVAWAMILKREEKATLISIGAKILVLARLRRI